MRSLLFPVLLAALPCQADPGRVLVLARQPANPQSVLYEVTPATGAWTALPGFPSDGLVPLAMAVDPATREPVVALASGASSRLVRVHLRGQQVLGERVLATLPGEVVGLCVPATGDVYAAVDGGAAGIHRVARQCCGATLFWSATGVSALSEPVVLPGKFWCARDLGAGGPVLDAFLDDVPASATGPMALPLLAGARLTGVHEYVQGGRHQLFADTLGRVHVMDVMPSTLSQVVLQPAIVPGGAVRLKGAANGQVYVLGGAADPTLKAFLQSSPQLVRPVTVVAGPFPGQPVDFAIVAPAVARCVRFGAPCASPAGGSIEAVRLPQVGQTAFALQLANGLPQSLSLCAVGWSERVYLGVPLPLPLGPCALLVAADAVVASISDAAGGATFALPVPANPALAGQILHAQWAQDLTSLRTSDALAVHVF